MLLNQPNENFIYFFKERLPKKYNLKSKAERWRDLIADSISGGLYPLVLTVTITPKLFHKVT